MATWPDKLEDLKDQYNSSAEQLADMLGITTRTLADLMKKEDEGGREPSKPIQRLIDNLLNPEHSERIKPYLNLVLIHPDFKVFKDDSDNTVDNIITTLISLNAESSRITAIADPRQSDLFRNEYHYIAIPNDDEQAKLPRTLAKKGVDFNLITTEDGVDKKKALDVFFSTTALMLVSKALDKKLAHVTIAADIETFWPLGLTIKKDNKTQNIGVTFVRQYGIHESEDLRKTIEPCQIIASPLGRCSGTIASIHPGGFGFIKDLDEPNKTSLFFSWNHMKLNGNGDPEIDIQQLKIGDRVSYTIGVNNKGPCATEIAIIERPDQTQSESVSVSTQQQILTLDEKKYLKNKLIDAICICADSDGWALLSDVGSRIKLMFPKATESLNAKGYRLLQFVGEQDEEFEYSKNGEGTNRSAACVRLKKLTAGKKYSE